MPSAYVFATLVALFMLLCAITDYRSKRIPNWLTVPAAILGLLFSSLAPGGIGIWAALGGFAIGMALLFLPWLLGGGGMGDVKMLAALGTWLGPLGILIAFGLGSVLAAFGMVIVLTANTCAHGFSSTRRHYVAAAAGGGSSVAPTKVRRVLPFAIPMAASTWLLLAWMLMRAGA